MEQGNIWDYKMGHGKLWRQQMGHGTNCPWQGQEPSIVFTGNHGILSHMVQVIWHELIFKQEKAICLQILSRSLMQATLTPVFAKIKPVYPKCQHVNVSKEKLPMLTLWATGGAKVCKKKASLCNSGPSYMFALRTIKGMGAEKLFPEQNATGFFFANTGI